MLKLSDFRASLEHGTVLTAQSSGFDILKNGDVSIPSLFFSCEDDYKFYLPYGEFFVSLDENLDIDKISYLLYKYVGSNISFVVTALDEALKVGIVSKIAADAKSQIEMLNPKEENRVKPGDIEKFTVLMATKRNLAITGCGVTLVLQRGDFPNIINQDLEQVFKKNDVIECEILEVINPKAKGEGFSLELKPVNYPQSEKPSLNEAAIYMGTILRVGKKFISVDVDGKLVSCQVPFKGVPLENTSAIVQVTKIKDLENNFYFGKLLSFEVPIVR